MNQIDAVSILQLVSLLKFQFTSFINMLSNDILKEINTKIRTSYYFDEITKLKILILIRF